MSEERKKHISHLKAMLRCCERVSSGTGNCGDDCDNCELQYAKGNMGEIKDTLAYAISSLETDEAYQLEYELTTKNNLGVEVPYLMHKEMDIPISECQKAYDVAMEYLRSQGKLKG